jgi:hypothetical protein
MQTARMKKITLASCLGGGMAAVLVLFFFDPEHTPLYPGCAFHRLTGLDCPGCGSLRALHALLHGHPVLAVHDNLLLVISLPVFAWLGFRCARNWIRGVPAHSPRPVWLWLYLGAWLVFGILRNLPFQPFASFAP